MADIDELLKGFRDGELTTGEDFTEEELRRRLREVAPPQNSEEENELRTYPFEYFKKRFSDDFHIDPTLRNGKLRVWNKDGPRFFVPHPPNPKTPKVKNTEAEKFYSEKPLRPSKPRVQDPRGKTGAEKFYPNGPSSGGRKS